MTSGRELAMTDNSSARGLMFVAFLTTSWLVGCAGESPAPDVASQIAPSIYPAGASICEPNETLLFMLRDDPDTGTDPYGCECTEVGLDACVTDTCPTLPDAECSPTRGFRCSGSYSYFHGPEGCAPGFLDDNVTSTCTGRLPRICGFDSDCPVGAYCSKEKGGVCWWDCLADCATHPASCCPEGSTCGCDGRCTEDVATPEAEVPRARLALEVAPSVLRFASGTDTEILSEARRVVIASRPLAGGLQPHDVTVVADRGLKVACVGTAHAPRPTVATDYRQSCAVTFDGAEANGRSVWVLPASLEAPVSPDGAPHTWSLTFVAGSGTSASTASVLVLMSEGADLAPTSGTYEGTITVQRAWLSDAALPASTSGDGLPVSGTATVPVTANVEMAAETVVTFFDSTRSVFPAGNATFTFADVVSDAPPTTTADQRFLELPWADWDQNQTTMSVSALQDDGTTTGFLVTGSPRLLTGRFGLNSGGLGGSLVPTFSFVFTLRQVSESLSQVPEVDVVAIHQPDTSIALADSLSGLADPTLTRWMTWIRLVAEPDSIFSCLFRRYYSELPRDWVGAKRGLWSVCEDQLAPAVGVAPGDVNSFCAMIHTIAHNDPSLPSDYSVIAEFYVPCITSGEPSCTHGSTTETNLACSYYPATPIDVTSPWSDDFSLKFCNIDAQLYLNGGSSTIESERDVLGADHCTHRFFSFDPFESELIGLVEPHTYYTKSHNTLYSMSMGSPIRPGMPNSGDLQAATKSVGVVNAPTVPQTFGFSYQEDATQLGLTNLSVLDASEMFHACISDLNRSVPDWVWDPSLVVDQTTNPADVDELLEELFQNDGCVSMANLVLSLDWMVDSEGNDRLFARRLQQWLNVHSFVARYGFEEADLLETLLGVDPNSETTTTLPEGVSWEDVLATVEKGWVLVLHPHIFAHLEGLDGASLADPDYRKDWVAPDEPILEGNYPDLNEGLPVALLEASAAQLELVTRYLAAKQSELATSKDPVAFRNTILTRYGSAFRTSLVVESLANTLFESAHMTLASGESVTWVDRWRQARQTLGAARDQALSAAALAARYANPLGIEDIDLPLYFVDPQGVNSRFFASSDYLLSSWARPAVQEAMVSLDRARDAWLNKRESAIRHQLAQNDVDRRLEDLKRRYGSVLVNACGLDVSEEEALDAFASGRYDIHTCFIADGGTSRELCLGRLAKAASLVADPDAVDNCGSGAEVARRLADVKKTLCTFARDFAVNQVTGNSEFEVLDSIVDAANADAAEYAHVKTAISLYTDVALPLAWDLAQSPTTGGQLDDDPEYLSAVCTYEGALPDVPCDVRFDTPTSWEKLDSVSTENCGATILVGGYRPGYLPETDDDLALIQHAANQMEELLLREDGNAFQTNKRHVVQGWCTQYLEVAADLSDVGRELINPTDLSQCLRGDLGSYHIQLLKAREQVRMAKVQLKALVDKYDAAMSHCLALKSTNTEMAIATERHLRAMESLRRTQQSASTVFGALNTLTSVVTAVVNPAAIPGAVQSSIGFANSISGQELADAAAAFERRHTLTMQKLSGEKELDACLLSVTNYESEVGTHVESIQMALLTVAEAMVSRRALETKLRNLIHEGMAAVEREQDRSVVSPSFHYWLDERVDIYQRDFAWAQRLTYLALRAIEYEAQASLPVRDLILRAKNPVALDEAIQEMEREQLTRSIGGSRPEEKNIVLSLTDELLRIGDRSSAPAGELQLTPTQGLQYQLFDDANAVFDEDGNYLGQGIRFTFEPQGPLQYRCAERLWSITATLQGDLLGVIAPRLPVFVLKRNSFRSQWCGDRGPDGEEFQTVSLRPSSDLMRPGTQIGDTKETQAYSWAYVDAWINVKRSDFYKDVYSEGSSEELAGRGLYGDYMLLIPWDGFLDSGVNLKLIEDILLRFDYLSVSDGDNLGDQPPLVDDEPELPRLTVEELQGSPGPNRMYLSWTNPSFIGLNSVIVRRSTLDYPATPDDGDLVTEIDCYAGECDSAAMMVDGGLQAGLAVYYTAFAVDEQGLFAATSWGGTPSAAPPVSGLTATPDAGAIDLAWTNPTHDGFSGVTVVRKVGGVPSSIGDGTTVYPVGEEDGFDESTTDTAVSVGVDYYYRAFGTDDFDVVTPGAFGLGWIAPEVTSIQATSSSGGEVTCWWPNPPGTYDTIKVLRTDTGVPPTAVDDPTAALVYQGFAGGFVESVDPNTTYRYRAFVCFSGLCSAGSPSAGTAWYQHFDNFESGMGNWSQVGVDDFDWTRHSGGTTSTFTGPEGAANSTSWYMYTEASVPNFPSKEAIFESEEFDAGSSSGASVSFYWSMYGEYPLEGTSYMGSLSLYVSDDSGGTWNLVWSMSGNQGTGWFQASVDLTPYVADTIQLRFQAITGSDPTYGFASDMAIDEIDYRSWGEP